MENNIEVIIDNGGGLTVQCDAFVHAYDGSSDEKIAKQSAHDVAKLLRGEDPSDWDGNEPDCRIDYTHDQLRNGAYWVLDNDDLRVIFEAPEQDVQGGAMGEAFAKALRAELR